MKRKSYIKNLHYNSYKSFNKYYLFVEYTRNDEYNRYTLIVNKLFTNEIEVRKIINN